MKCQLIKMPLGMGAKDWNKADESLNEWLQANAGVKIISVTQVLLGNNTVLTTIIYE